MSVEFIGYITNNNSSETVVRTGPILDRHYIETVAKAHETAGFDRALLAFHSTAPDGLQVGQHVLGVTDRLHVLIAQRPGFTAPTLIARQLATIDQLSGGRVSLHVITGGNANELKQDGNTIDDKDERYARTDEFLDIVRSEWTSEKPFSYDGKYYQVQNGFSHVKPYRSEGIPIFVGGASDAAIEVAAGVCGENNVRGDTRPSMGAEDFSYMLERVPGAMVWLGNGGGADAVSLHNSRYDFNDMAIPFGVSFFVRTVERFLGE